MTPRAATRSLAVEDRRPLPAGKLLLSLVLMAATAGGCGPTGTGDPQPDPEPTTEPDPVGPTAVIEGALTGPGPLALSLTAAASTAGDEPIATYAWRLDDEVLSTDAVFQTALLVEGEHALSLTVEDEAGLSDTATATVVVEQEPCPSFASGSSIGSLPGNLPELSGLVVSRDQEGVFWGHNDSGDYPDVYAMNEDGSFIGIWTVENATAYDWEDIAIGPGPDEELDYLYAADIGDNDYVRSSVVVYRFPEPSIRTAMAPYAVARGTDTFTFTYPGGAQNAEAMIVDPRTGDLFIMTKTSSGPTRVFRRAAPLSSGALEQVASFTTGNTLSAALVTAADISPLGNQILVRTYDEVHLFLRRGTGTVADALSSTACAVPTRVEAQGESIAFFPDGRAYVTASEGAGSPIYRFERND